MIMVAQAGPGAPWGGRLPSVVPVTGKILFLVEEKHRIGARILSAE
jgi:hypothetical protein